MNADEKADRGDSGEGLNLPAMSIFDALRQWQHPPEWRIVLPVDLGPEVTDAAQSQDAVTNARQTDRLLAEVATCFWYLKTKHFKRDWDSDETDDDDPRVRRALGRLNKGIDALAAGGVEIEDPTNKRYPEGAENMMRPIQLQPTAGISAATVSETVTPIVYRGDQLVQRGEVFVATPKEVIATPTPRQDAPYPDSADPAAVDTEDVEPDDAPDGPADPTPTPADAPEPDSDPTPDADGSQATNEKESS